jgi:hypothetical protein
MSTLGRTRIRLAGDAANFNGPLDVHSSATPQFWRGNEVAVLFNGALQSVANLASVTLEIRAPGPAGAAPDPSATPLMSATVDRGALDDTLTLDTWNDGSQQHALLAFTAAQSNIAAGPQWLSLWVLTTDSPGRVITLAAGPVRVLEDGAGLATTPPTPDDTYYTAAQSDARYLAVDDTADIAAARTLLGLGTAATHDVPASGNATSAQAVLGNDTRLTDSRTPATHASTHAAGGSDALTLAESQVTNLVSDLAAKAPLASPALTGTPTAPTPALDDNSTKIATTAAYQAQMARFLAAIGQGALSIDGGASSVCQTVVASAQHSFADGCLSLRIRFFATSLQNCYLAVKAASSTVQEYYFQINNSGAFLIQFISAGGPNSGGATQWITPNNAYAAGKWCEVVLTLSGSTPAIYVNGIAQTLSLNWNPTPSFATGGAMAATSSNLNLGGYIGANSLQGAIALCQFWNRCLSAAEVLTLFAGAAPVDFPDIGASQTAISSGSLTVGKRYRIQASGGTFTGVGAANNSVGTEFVATGTSPTWSTGTLVRIGCCAQIESESLQPAPGQWLDLSGNGAHLLQPASGTLPTKLPPRFKFVQTISAAAFLGGSARAVLPANYVVSEIIADTAGTPTISVGQDATNKTTRVASVTLAAGKTPLTLVTSGRTGSNAQLYVDMSAGAASTTFTVIGFIAN